MAKSSSNRILVTPSSYAKAHYLYVQEVGSLKSLEPHISSRKNLNSYLFFVVVNGHGTLTYQNETISLSAGDCVWIDCHLPYAHESSESDPWSLTWVHFDGNDAAHFYQSYVEQELPFRFHPGNILPFVETINTLYESCRSQDFLSELKNNRSLTDLITMIYEQQERPETSTSGKLAQIRAYIDNHYAQKLSLDSLSEQFFISKYHLSREYHHAYGTTISNDITNRRISHAKSSLRFSDDPIEQIAESCGFQDGAYFINVFKKAEGITPLQYRKKWRS